MNLQRGNNSRPRHRRQSILSAVTLATGALLGAFASAPADTTESQGNVTIVLSGDQGPYKSASAAAAESIKDLQPQARTIMLAELDEKSAASARSTDIYVAVGTEAAVKLHRMLPDGAALVYCMTAGADAQDLTTGRSATRGITAEIPIPDQVALLAEALPAAKRLGVLYRASNARSCGLLSALKAALPGSMSLEAVDLDARGTVADALKELLSRHLDAIWSAPDSSVFSGAAVQAILKEALAAKVPVFGFSTQFVRAGAIVGVGVRSEDQGRRAGELVREALSGQPVRNAGSGAPIQEPPRTRIAVNTLVAERLGITLPGTLVSRADDVFGE